jgi:glucose/arabinose dehydrogenase
VQFPAHATPTGLTFYTGSTYPQEFFDNAFAALWTRGEVARIVLNKTPQGEYRASPSVWASGFLYPIDVVNGPDGNLYIADFGTSVIYRITYDAAQ